MRVKSRGNCSSAFGPETVYASGTFVSDWKKKEIWDTEIPGFHALLKCGKFLPINPVIITTTAITRSTGGPGYQNQNAGGCVRTLRSWDQPDALEAGWLIEPPGGFDETMMSYVLNSARASCKAASFDALTNLGELTKVIELFRKTAASVDGAIRKIIPIIQRRYRKHIGVYGASPSALLAYYHKEFGQLWLEYRYGWMPLLYSLEDALFAIRGHVEGDLILGRGFIRETINEAENLSWNSSPHDYWSTTQTLTGYRLYRSACYATAHSSWNKSVGFDPLVSAWELLKFSFVIDWLIDVGSWLQAISPFSRGVSVNGQSVSVKDVYERKQVTSLNWPGPTFTGTGVVTTTTETVETYNRFPEEPSLPGFNPRLNIKKATDLVFLITQLASLPIRLLRI
jgi:hypothetical protein